MVKKGRVITGYVSSQGDPGGGLRTEHHMASEQISHLRWNGQND